MALENKLGQTSSAELAREEERISKKKALELFESRTGLYSRRLCRPADHPSVSVWRDL